MSMSIMGDLILGWDIVVRLSEGLLGWGCYILWYGRTNKLSLNGCTMGLTENHILGLRRSNSLCLSKARWGEAKVETWYLVIWVHRPRVERG